MLPTTKDLAKAAGVSLATVDRVLNNRPNVSKKAKKQVDEAIERIGFVRNLAAASLAKNKTYQFRFLLPHRGDQYLAEIINQVGLANNALKQDRTMVDVVQIDMNDPHKVAHYLSVLDQEQVDGLAIMAPESPPVRDAIVRLNERAIKTVQFLSGQERLEDLDFVGIDNYAAGATAARILGSFLRGVKGKVLVIAETMQSLDSIQRRFGFDRVLNEKFKNLAALPSLETYGDLPRAKLVIANTFKHQSDIAAVYLMSSEARGPVSVIEEFCDIKDIALVVHERTPFTEQSLREEKIDAVIAQNPGHAVRSAIRILRAGMENRQRFAAQDNIRIEVLLKENL